MADTFRKKDDSMSEEASALGQRAKGAIKDAAGAVTGNERLEREGERENAQGRARQASNEVFDETDGVRGASVAPHNWLTGSFRDRETAERAYQSLSSRGYERDDVNLLMSNDTRDKYFTEADTELGSKALEGAGVGSAIGGTAGALLGALLAAGSIAIPGVGVIVAGSLAAALAGAGAGGLTGGVIGALVGAGIPEDRAKEYDEDIRRGHIVMGVRPRSAEDAEYFEREWRNANCERIYR
jgi:uncharacterized protein YjbJ (UPF0337 family)